MAKKKLSADIAAKRIQKAVRLSKFWSQFQSDPAQVYSRLTDDELAKSQFGHHIAGFKEVPPMTYPPHTSNGRGYHRESNTVHAPLATTPVEALGALGSACAGTTPSPWEVSIAQHSAEAARSGDTKDTWGEQVLSQYAGDPQALRHCDELSLLKQISKNPRLNYAVHAQELGDIIERIGIEYEKLQPGDLSEGQCNRLRDNCARAHLFLSVAVHLHNNDHEKFCAMIEPLFHELTLMVHDISTMTQEPMATHAEFSLSVRNEFIGSDALTGLDEGSGVDAKAFAANSGMHAYTLALLISKKLLGEGVENESNISWRRDNPTPDSNGPFQFDHYFETVPVPPELLGSTDIDDYNADVHSINASIMGFGAYTSGDKVNDYVERMRDNGAFEGEKKHVLIVDTTCADMSQFQLSHSVKSLLAEKKLSIVAWESWQKFGQNGLDQIQFGRTIVIDTPEGLERLNALDKQAESDARRIDMQMGGLMQVVRRDSQKYRRYLFDNGTAIREQLFIDPDHTGPFVQISSVVARSHPDNFTAVMLSPPIASLQTVRDSFGFNTATRTGARISPGSEPSVDVKIYTMFVDKVVSLCPGTYTMRSKNRDSRILNDFITNATDSLNHYLDNYSHEDTVDFPSSLHKRISYLFLAQHLIEMHKKDKLPLPLHFPADKVIQACQDIMADKKTLFQQSIYEKKSPHGMLGESNKSFRVLTRLVQTLKPLQREQQELHARNPHTLFHKQLKPRIDTPAQDRPVAKEATRKMRK